MEADISHILELVFGSEEDISGSQDSNSGMVVAAPE